MKHARTDYDERVQDSQGIIPMDEPVFLIRGQDPAAYFTLSQYAATVEDLGAAPDFVKSIREHAKKMEDWYKNLTKRHVPDAPKGTIPSYENPNPDETQAVNEETSLTTEEKEALDLPPDSSDPGEEEEKFTT